MVVFSVIAVATILNGGKGASEGARVGGQLGSVGVGAAMATGTEAAAIVGLAAGGGIVYGSIVGATATRTAAGFGVGALSGVTSACAVSTSGLGAGALFAGKGGIGLLTLGASNNSKEDGTTFDCWKQVIHDESKEPSRGILLKEICSHPNVMKVTTTEGNHPDLPRIVIENIWNEVFEIQYLWVHATGNIICHALPI